MRVDGNPYVPTPVRVLDNVRETPENITLTLALRLVHEPGQFVQVSVLGVGEAPISIASWGGDTVTLHIREVGNVTRALAGCRPGDSVFVRGPYGNGFPMADVWGHNLVLAGGGCGVASLKGVIEYVHRHRDEYGDVTIFLGFRSAQDLIFPDRVEHWRTHFPVYVSLDTLREGQCLDASEGFVSDLMRRTDIPPGESAALLCGPPVMMRLAAQVLEDKGLEDSHICLSMERLMYCAIGQCCHCMIGGKFTCLDGPVFRWDALKGHMDG